MHSIDRLVRVLLAIIIGFLIINGTLTGTVGIIFGIISIVFLVTGIISFCPLYKALGISTAKNKIKTV
jgi:hypothetical protein